MCYYYISMRFRRFKTIKIDPIHQLKIKNAMEFKAQILFDIKEQGARKSIEPCLFLTHGKIQMRYKVLQFCHLMVKS